MNKISLIVILILVLAISALQAQLEYRIHDRGMLHNTLYNSGDIGRPWTTGDEGNKTSVPLMEWPSRSATILNGITYSGQHNLLGGGMYMAANLKGQPGMESRIYAMCGAVGTGSGSETIIGRWTFPISLIEIENFPLLPDGTMNENYDPNEAEEIIIAEWATPVGVNVKRTTRAWSHPDYDDMIIYEYELEYTGDTNGDGIPDQTEELRDFMALFIWGFGPSMYGYQRNYQEWKYDSGLYRGDQNNFWDADYWLSFNMSLRTNISDATLFAKPEPNKDLFLEFAATGKNGGGLASPQAPGYAVLYYDVNHLAFVDTIESEQNESEFVGTLRTQSTFPEYPKFYELDEKNHVKQPYSNKVSTGNTRSSKMQVEAINTNKRWSGVYSLGSTTWPAPPTHPDADKDWIGRAAYPYRQSADAAQKHIVFGPYTLNIGDRLEYSFAEVVGYGAQPGKVIEGGQTLVQWAATPSWDRPVPARDGSGNLTDRYLTEFGYPDYVNSEVRTVTQVAHKAFEAYLGEAPAIPVWPEDNPPDGVYNIEVRVPAPVITVLNTPDGQIKINWGRSVEEFVETFAAKYPISQLSGTLTKFYISRSDAGMGPWTVIDSISAGDPAYINSDNQYEYFDDDVAFKIGESRYYSVQSIDENGLPSGRTNISRHEKNIGSVANLDEVFVVPNPFVIQSGFGGAVGAEERIGFYGLPARATIRIFTYSGQLVETIEHDDPVYSTAWFQVTRNDQQVASGIYLYVITTPNGEQASGKFIVIK